jgi:PPOX class probable F420-dependent enzyme
VPICDEKYVLLTTFRRSGDAVTSPVWIVGLSDGAAGFSTEIDSGKVKRIRNNPSVTLQACGIRGKVHPGAPVIKATAQVLEGADAHEIGVAINRKYRFETALLAVGGLIHKLLRRAAAPNCAVRIRFE